MPIPKYVSAEEYSRQSGMGPEEVKRLCRIGKIPCMMTEGGYYKIPIYDDAVPIEKYRELEKRCDQLEAVMQTINTASKIYQK